MLAVVTFIIMKNDNILRQKGNSNTSIIKKNQRLGGASQGIENGSVNGTNGDPGQKLIGTILEGFFQAVGHLLIILTNLLFVPTFILFAEVERCVKEPSEQESNYFTCMDKSHSIAVGSVAIGSFSALFLAMFTCLFVNSQFPCKNSIPQAIWDPKPRSYLIIWKVVYAFHYDIFDPKYRVAFRVVLYYVIYVILQAKLEQPRVYDKAVHLIEFFFYSFLAILQAIVILQDTTLLSQDSLARELLPMLLILTILFFAILYIIESHNHKQMISRESKNIELFESETDMELYINILLGKLSKLKDGGHSQDKYASTPQIFTIISRHMENCQKKQDEDCICRKYEPEFDKKFSSQAFSSRNLTRRISQSITGAFSFSNFGRSDSSIFRRKMPTKISYQSKCDIFMAEVVESMERFLLSPQCRSHGAGVGLKLQKSYFYHTYMDSSYKALFVQLENSYQCNTFRGRVNIYHLKTRIQEEMTQSESSPISSLDITSCLKFESQRIIFESRIVDLCLSCEQFWTELINKNNNEPGRNTQKNSQNEDEEETQEEKRLREQEEMEQKLMLDDYNVEKMNTTLLDIADTVIDVKNLFAKLCQINSQSVAVLQSYALVYKYILRDEYRFEEIVSQLGQVHRTNKLEQSRDNTPMFCDSDDYALILVSGDLKDFGRIMRVNRAVDQLFGFTPDELKGSKIEKLMPSLYAHVHEDFMQSFLKRGFSKFIDKNQFLLAQDKLGFLTSVLAYIKALVDLKLGLMFVAFFKAPVKIPLTYDNKDGGCNAAPGTQFVKTNDAHFILCDGNGYIYNMSQNCMKNLGLPPTVVYRKSKAISNSQQENQNQPINDYVTGQNLPVVEEELDFTGNKPVRIDTFAPGILGPEFEFDLVRGLNFLFDSSKIKQNKSLVKEFNEIKNRMCRYNIQIAMRRSNYRQRIGAGAIKSTTFHQMILFTIVINSYSFTDTPNIIIPVFRDEEDQIAQYLMPMPTVSSIALNSDEMRSSKFKEFKAHVQELKLPSKILKLRRITIGFFFFLLGVFSLNYGICLSQSQIFEDRVAVRDILYQLTDKIPQTARYMRTIFNIANGFEPNTNEVMSGLDFNEDRFQYYIRRVSENSESFRVLQQDIYTRYSSQLSYDQTDGNDVLTLKVKDLQTDYSIKEVPQTFSSALNLFLSKALKLTKLNITDLNNMSIPYLDFRSSKEPSQSLPVTSIQQDLYFIFQNGNEALPNAVHRLTQWSEGQIVQQSGTYNMVSIVIAISSLVAIIVIVIPLVFPLLTHYEIIAEIILHTLNKLTKKFVEDEVKCCKQLYDHISNMTEQEKIEEQQEQQQLLIQNEDSYSDSLVALKRLRSRKQHSQQSFEAITPVGGQSASSQIIDFQSALEEEKSRLLKRKTQLRQDSAASSPEELKRKSTRIQQFTGLSQSPDGKNKLRRYSGRSHMPPVLRRASFYQKMKEIKEVPEIDSFGEDDSRSSSSSQSNFSHQEYHTNQIQIIKQLGLLDPNNENSNGGKKLGTYELTHPKSSDMLFEPFYMRDKQEEKELKSIVAQRQQNIHDQMKKRKCRKLISISLFVLAISIYLAVNTFYTYMVFRYESDLQGNLRNIDSRMLCYSFSLSVLKEMISRNQEVSGILEGFNTADSDAGKGINTTNVGDRQQIVRCLQYEQDFIDLTMGNSDLSSSLTQLTPHYQEISDSLSYDKFCPTILAYQSSKSLIQSSLTIPDYLTKHCTSVLNGLNQLGLHEVLNFILREQEKIVIAYRQNATLSNSAYLLYNSTLMNQEMLSDVFLTFALSWQRHRFIQEIQAFATYLFDIFDILFSVFVTALFIGVGFVGMIYINRILQRKIIQIYHIVMLIPYGDRTRKELNELIKIDL